MDSDTTNPVHVDTVHCPCDCHAGGPYTPCTVPGGCGHLHTVAHRCRRADRCAEWEYLPGDDTHDPRIRVGAPINAENGLCLWCVRHVTRALTELPRDYTELHAVLGAVDAGTPEILVSSSPDLRVPLRLGVEALMAAMVTESVCWAEIVAERMRVDWDTTLVDRHTRPGVALQRATRLLAAAVSPLLAIQDWTRMVWDIEQQTTVPETTDGITGAITLLELHQQARRVLGLTRRRHRLPATCPTCERLTLARDDGDEDVWCTTCGETFTDEEYHRHVGVLAAAARDGGGG